MNWVKEWGDELSHPRQDRSLPPRERGGCCPRNAAEVQKVQDCAPELRTNVPHIQHSTSSGLQGRTGRAQEQQWALNLLHPQPLQAEVLLGDCPRLGASLNRAGRFLGNDQGSYRVWFLLWTGQLHRIIQGLIHQPNLNWAEGRRREDVVRRHTSPIIWHPEGAGGQELLCTLCSYWASQVHTGCSTRPPSTRQ